MADLAYLIENTNSEEYRDNSKVFELISDLELDVDKSVFIDSGDGREEFEALVKIIAPGDRLIIRSVVELACSTKALLNSLETLQSVDIRLCSVNEPFLSGTDLDRLH